MHPEGAIGEDIHSLAYETSDPPTFQPSMRDGSLHDLHWFCLIFDYPKVVVFKYKANRGQLPMTSIIARSAAARLGHTLLHCPVVARILRAARLWPRATTFSRMQ